MHKRVHSTYAASAAMLLLAASPCAAAKLQIIYQATALDGAVGYASQLFTPLPVAGGGVLVETAGGGTADEQIILLTPGAAGQPYTRTLVHDFNNGCSSDGGHVNGLLEADAQGNVWGITEDDCGTPGGTLFKLTQPATAGGSWTYQVVLQLPASLATSYAGSGYNDFLFDKNGNLFGLLNFVSNSGACTTGGEGCGVIFEIPAVTTAGSAASFKILAELPAVSDDFNGISRDAKGNLYTTSYTGGSAGYGAVWQVSPPAKHATAWTATDIHDFCVMPDIYKDCVDGAGPTNAPAVGPNGVLYGASETEGPGWNDGVVNRTPFGVIWSLTPPAVSGGSWTETNLAVLGGAPGTYPSGVAGSTPLFAPLLTKTGKIATVLESGPDYNVTSSHYVGSVLELARTGVTGATVSKGFAAYGEVSGALTPNSKITQDSAGNLYGTTEEYLTVKNGTQTSSPAVIYKITN